MESIWFKYLIIVITLVSIHAYMTYIQPRPYFLTTITDVECDYYYNSKLVYFTGTPNSVNHPGTPIYYIGALIMLIAGHEIAETQTFFNYAYTLTLFVTIFSVIVFTKLLIENIPIGIFSLILASIIIWPPLWFYFNRFSTDSFSIPLGLLAYIFFWRSLKGNYDKRGTIISGVFMGLCMSSKLAFIPFVLVLSLASTVHVLFAIHRKKTQYYSLFILPASIIASFVFFLTPVIFKIPSLLYYLISREEVKDLMNFTLSDSFLNLFGIAQTYTIFASILTIIYLIFFCRHIYRSFMGYHNENDSIDQTRFDHFSAGLSIIGMCIAFIFLTSTVPSINLMYKLRNLSSTSIFLPMMLIHLLMLIPKVKSFYKMKYQLLFVVFSVLISSNTLNRVLSERSTNISENLIAQKSSLQTFNKYKQPGKKIALWMEHGGGIQTGKESFHWWGGYKWAVEYFNKEIQENFPDYTQIRIGKLALELSKNESVNSNWFDSLKVLVRSYFPSLRRVQYEKKGNIVANEDSGGEISAVIIPNNILGDKLNLTKEKFFEIIKERFGLNNIKYIDDLVVIL